MVKGDQSPTPTRAYDPANSHPFQPLEESELPDNAFGKLVQQGHAIVVETKKYAPEYVGNGLACTNCHLDQGRKANSAPLWAAYTLYPAYRKKNDKVNSYAERLQGCFQFSMNGKAPAAASPIIAALSAYSYWLGTGARLCVIAADVLQRRQQALQRRAIDFAVHLLDAFAYPCTQLRNLPGGRGHTDHWHL